MIIRTAAMINNLIGRITLNKLIETETDPPCSTRS